MNDPGAIRGDIVRHVSNLLTLTCQCTLPVNNMCIVTSVIAAPAPTREEAMLAAVL